MTWLPRDYILFGKYCTTEVIYDLLREMRRECNALSVLLIVRQEGTVFQSLLLLSHEVPEREAACVTALGGAPLDPIPDCLNRSPDQLAAAVCQQLSKRGVADAFRNPIVFSRQLPLHSTNSILTTAVVISYGDIANSADRSPSPESSDPNITRYLDQLCVMAAASAPIQTYRDLLQIQATDRVLNAAYEKYPISSDASWTSISESLARAALDAAVSATESTGGLLYLATSRRQKLVLAACLNGQPAQSELRIGNSQLAESWCYRTGKALVINDIGSLLAAHPIRYLWGGTVDHENVGFQITIPIQPWHSVPGVQRSIGVINLRRLHGHYTYKDLSIVRDIALRHCFRSSDMFFTVSTHDLRGLVKEHSKPPEQPVLRVNQPVDQESMQYEVPLDVVACKTEILRIVERLFLITKSCSSSFRVLSPAGRKLVSLCFVSETPDDVGTAPKRISLYDKRSVHSWVARVGRYCYIPDLQHVDLGLYLGLQGTLNARRGSHSELCVPISAGSYLIGTLNLESRYPDAYADQLPAILAIAEQIGVCVTRQRLLYVDIVWSRAASVTINIHEIFKSVDALRAIGAKTRVNERKDIASDISRVADQIMQAVEQPKAQLSNQPDVYSLVEQVAGSLGIDSIEWQGPILVLAALSELQCVAVRLALTSILENARDESRRTDDLRIWIRTYSRTLGGSTYAVLGIENAVTNSLPGDLRCRLYRVPIFSDRVHIGAFMAGAAIRAIGGEVYVKRLGNNRVRTLLEIPLPSQGFNARTGEP